MPGTSLSSDGEHEDAFPVFLCTLFKLILILCCWIHYYTRSLTLADSVNQVLPKISTSGSETRSKKMKSKASEAKEVFDSVFEILMEFVNKAETIVPKQSRLVVAVRSGVHDEKHEKFDKTGEKFDMLPLREQAKVLEELWEEILEDLLGRLPEEGKEALLVRCYDGLYQRLHEEPHKKMDAEVEGFGEAAEAIVWTSEIRSKDRIDGEASETEKVFDSVFDILMDFAEKAETIDLKRQTRLILLQETVNECIIDAREASDEFSPSVLKELWRDIVWRLLKGLPEEGKEAFLVRCFDLLYQKLPEESRKKVDKEIMRSHYRAAGSYFWRCGPPENVIISRTKVRYPSQVGRPPQPNPPPQPHSQPNPPYPPPRG